MSAIKESESSKSISSKLIIQIENSKVLRSMISSSLLEKKTGIINKVVSVPGF